MNEQDSIRRLKRGDIGGLEWLVRTHQVEAMRVAMLITGDRAIAEDLVQNAFLRVYERIAQFDAERSFGPWFLRIVANDALKEAGRQRKLISWNLLLSGSLRFSRDLASDPAEMLAQAETVAEIRRALSALPPIHRTAVVQRYYLGWTEQEMADEAACPPGTIKSRLHKARQRLHHLLTGYHRTGLEPPS